MIRLNFKHLQYFWIVAKEGSIARASKILHLTPQTISGQLSLLEESMGTKLFSKTGRNLTLTETGRLAYGYAEEIFSLGSELEDMLKNKTVGTLLPFSVGIADVLPKLIAYRLLEPALHLPEPVRIVCHEDKIENLLADIAVHKLDMVLTDTPIKTSVNVKAFNHLLGECGISFFAAPALSDRLGDNFPLSLNRAPILLPTAGAAVRGALLQWFETKQIHPHVAGEFDDSALMKAFGQAGIGAFSAPTVIEQEVMQQYKVRLLGRTDEVREQFYAISTERRLKHPAVVALSDIARNRIFGQR